MATHLVLSGVLSLLACASSCPVPCRCTAMLIYCNERNLSTVPGPLPVNSTALYLQNNHISDASLPLGLRNLQRLQLLHLYGNKLRNFPLRLPYVLRELHLEENDMQTISARSLSMVPHLEVLHLEVNHLTVPGIQHKAFQVLTKLRKLFLSRNWLSVIPDGLPESLEQLGLNNNKIRVISEDVLSKLTRLKHLYLDGNLLSTKAVHQQAFSGLHSLVEISPSQNNLEIIPANVPGKNLRMMHLQDNIIAEIPKESFSSMEKLSFLDLSGNALRTLMPGALTGLDKIRQLFVKNNPWHCDCKMLWLKDWVLKRRFSDLMCSTPKELKDQSFYDVPLTMLTCPESTTPLNLTASLDMSWTSTTSFTATRYNLHDDRTSQTPIKGEIQGNGSLLIQVVSVSSDSIKVLWSSHGPLTAYELRLQTGKQSAQLDLALTVDRGRTEHEFLNLTPETTYRICLRAREGQHIGKVQACVQTRTKDASIGHKNSAVINEHQANPINEILPLPMIVVVIICSALLLMVLIVGVMCWCVYKPRGVLFPNCASRDIQATDSDYMEAGTKKDDSILEMREGLYQPGQIGEMELTGESASKYRHAEQTSRSRTCGNKLVYVDNSFVGRNYYK
uniref:leucine-rich repeat transmembrane protein FLRT3-like n=1 Tax=Myxine glutinosa TaxID=7769 RepID=UPI00358F8343